MKKSARILVIAAFIFSAIVMTSCSFLFSPKPSGTYYYETSTGSLRSKQVYEFRGSNFEYRAYSDLLGTSYDEPWMTMKGTFTVDEDVATLVETNTGLGVKFVMKTTDNWKSFTDENGHKYTKKGL